ncbi:MAG: phosphatidylglycerophosphatase A [Acidobacteriota bacterium]
MNSWIVPQPVRMHDRVALLIATGFGVGYSPVAPGTVGSFLGILVILALSAIPMNGGQRLIVHFVLVGLISACGIWAASRAELLLQKNDPPQVVIDEIVGQLLTYGLLFRHPRFMLLLLGFVFFRLFDIIKPFPIRRLERVPMGFGIILDDLAAGFYASLALVVVDVFWGSLF